MLWQSQPVSATLRNIFEKHFRRRQEIEFFSWPGIDFLPDFGNFPVSDRADIRSFLIYCRTSLFPFSMALFCHAQYKSAKNTGTSTGK